MSTVPFTCPKCGSPTKGIIKVHHFNAPINYNRETGELDYNFFDSTIGPGRILDVFCTNPDCHWFADSREVSVAHMRGKPTDMLPY